MQLLGDNTNTISFPIRLRLTKDFVLTGKLGSGGEGVVYLGFESTDRNKVIALKAFRSKSHLNSYQNEVKALKIQSALVDESSENMIIVRPFVQGKSLYDRLKNEKDPLEYEWLVKEYNALPGQFRKRWGLVHGDVRPANVLVDQYNNFHLIDFGKTFKVSEDPALADLHAQEDDRIAKSELEFFLEEQSAFKALQNPLEPGAELLYNSYLDRVWRESRMTLDQVNAMKLDFQRRKYNQQSSEIDDDHGGIMV